MAEFARTLKELKQKAVLFWPQEIVEREAALTSLPRLLETQDHFISVLVLGDKSPFAWKEVVDISPKMPANLFLKHLMVLTDLGGEALSKIIPLEKFFANGEMRFVWRKEIHAYTFRAFSTAGTRFSNSALRVDGNNLTKAFALNGKLEDAIMLLMLGSASISDTLPVTLKEKCLVSSLVGRPTDLEQFVKQNYIRISRQVGGATSNAMGQMAQSYVLEVLREELPGWTIKTGKIPGISHNDGETETSFDVVVKSPDGIYFGIEVSFQFTTNSVIERKAREAQARQNLLHKAGHYICYVVDGAGNINVRESAVRTICQFSDCTVAYSRQEIQHLARFIKVTQATRKQKENVERWLTGAKPQND